MRFTPAEVAAMPLADKLAIATACLDSWQRFVDAPDDNPEVVAARTASLARNLVALCSECGQQFPPATWHTRAHQRRCIAAHFPPPPLQPYVEPPRRSDWPWQKTETDSRG